MWVAYTVTCSVNPGFSDILMAGGSVANVPTRCRRLLYSSIAMAIAG